MAIVQSEGALRSLHRPDHWGRRPRGVTLYANKTATYGELYRQQPNVRTVIAFLARNIGQLGLGVYERVSKTERRPAEGEAAEVFKRPFPRVTRGRFVRTMVSDLAIYDHYAALKLRHTETGRLNIAHLPGKLVEPIGDNWLEPDAIRVHFNKGHQDLPRESVVWIHGYNPDDPRLGVSPLEALRSILAEEASSAEWREQFWRGGARIAGVIERPADAPRWGSDERERFSEEWHAAYAGPQGEEGRTPVLEDGMEWKEATFSPRDAEYLGARKLTREEVAAAYFIPPAFVGILEHANFANIKEQHRSLYQDTLGPWLDWLTEELELQVLEDELGEPDLYLDFNIEEKLRGSFEKQATAIQSSTGAPWMTRNEARALRNLEPVDGGDELVVPLNVLIGDQASPTDSAPSDGPPPAPVPDDDEEEAEEEEDDQGEPGTAARPAPTKTLEELLAKAIDDLPRDVQGWRARTESELRRFFTRQRDSVMPRLRAGTALEAAFDRERWDDELRVDLLRLADSMSTDIGGATAERFGAEYDPDLAFAYLEENARIAAESINGATYNALGEARGNADPRLGYASLLFAGAKLEDLDDEEELEDPVLGVFSLAITVRAVEASISRVTGVSSFARNEGARQAGVRSKVWVVNASGESRHAAIAGETVPIGDTFSNGLRWPGDSAGSVDDTAGCLCSLDFEL